MNTKCNVQNCNACDHSPGIRTRPKAVRNQLVEIVLMGFEKHSVGPIGFLPNP